MSLCNTARTAYRELLEEVACTSGRNRECTQLSGCTMLKELLINLVHEIAAHVDATCTPKRYCSFSLLTGMPFQLLLLTDE